MMDAPSMQVPAIGEDSAVLLKHLDATAELVERALAQYKLSTARAIVEATTGIVVVTALMPSMHACVYALGDNNQSFLIAQLKLRPDG
jgi:hypothetical protein